MRLCRVCMLFSLSVFLPVLRALRVLCSVFCSKFLTSFLFSFCPFYKFNRHLCHGAYSCTHKPANMPNFFSICIFISLIPAYVYLNMFTHFSPLPYSHTFMAIFICMVCVLFYTYYHLFLFFFFSHKFNRHLCHGAYSCTYKHAHMPIFFFHMRLHFSNSCVRVSKHVYAFPSSSIFIHISRHIHLYGLCSVLYL